MRTGRSALGLLLVTVFACGDGSGDIPDPDAAGVTDGAVVDDVSEPEDVGAPEPDSVEAFEDVDEPDPQDTPTVGDVDEPLPGDAGGEAHTCESYDDSVQPIFDQHCTNCHNVPDADNLLNLTAGASYQSLKTTISQADPSLVFVVPGDASASYLVEKLNPGPSYGHVMPITGPAGGTPIPATQRQTIVDWIDAGAALEPWGCP